MKYTVKSFLLGLLLTLPHISADAVDDSNVQGVEYTITHFSVDGGYSRLEGSDFVMVGVVGQADAERMQQNDTVFSGGFLHANSPILTDFIFSDNFEIP